MIDGRAHIVPIEQRLFCYTSNNILAASDVEYF